MAFNLSDFMNNNKDFSRSYTFYADVPLDGFTGDEQRYLVRNTSLPASTITPLETNWQGNIYKMGSTQEFTDFTITYSVDVQDKIRDAYLLWMSQIHEPATNAHGLPLTYMRDITLTHLNHIDGSDLMQYKLIGAWPSMIGELMLDYSSKEIASFDVTFTYQYHIKTPV